MNPVRELQDLSKILLHVRELSGHRGREHCKLKTFVIKTLSHCPDFRLKSKRTLGVADNRDHFACIECDKKIHYCDRNVEGQEWM